MILKEDDIYNGFESHRNKNGLSQEQMAIIIGLKTKQAYANMIKNKTMKLKYLINLINNTGISSDSILNPESRKKQAFISHYQIEEQVNAISDDKITFYTCPDCIAKENEIKQWKDKLLDKCMEVDDINLKYQKLLEDYIEIKKETSPASDKKVG